MSSKGRDLLKLSGIITVAFAAGLAFASALNLPRPGQAESSHPVNTVTGGARAPLRTVDGVLPSFADIAERVRPSVVYITIQRTERAEPQMAVPREFEEFFRRQQRQPRIREGSGSGFIVSQDGYILTNNHVVAEADKVKVTLLDNRQYDARVVGRDPATDVAVIKINADHLTPLPLGNADGARIGDWVLAVGNPLNFTFTVTAGIVSAKGRGLAGLTDPEDRYQIQDFIQTDAAINPGNSGGPLVNLQGEVIGVNSAIASQTGFYSGYGFAIPINLARRVMDDLIATGRVQRAVLGISIRAITPEDAEAVGLREIRGVVVQDFSGKNSPAKAAGVQAGDVIVALNDSAIDHVAQLQTIVGFKRPGEVVRVEVVRSGGLHRTYQVRLTAAATETDSTQLASGGADRTRVGAVASEASTKLGFEVEAMSSDLVRAAGVSEDQRGPVISDVEEGGPAWGRLLAPNQGGPDVVLWVNQTRTRTREDFLLAIHAFKAGEVATLRVVNLSDRSFPMRVVRLRTR